MSSPCPHCGTRLSETDDAFCPECRRPVGEAPSQAIAKPGTLIRRPATWDDDREEGSRERINYLEARLAELEQRLQQSNLYSESFLTRAFTVYGHFLVAHLCVIVPLMIAAICLGGLAGR